MEYDLIVLGTGGAGYQVAMRCRQAGWRVAAVDRGPFGGTCSVRGCIPKKILSGTAEIADTARRLQNLGIITQAPVFSWAELVKFKRSFTDPVPGSTRQALEEAGIDVFEGAPRFTGDRQLSVNGQQLAAKKVHIAVGLEPAKLSIDGFEHLATSDDFLELDELPKRIVFIGGGYISFEFAHIAARFGAQATILHTNERPLPMFDADIVQTLCDASKEAGIAVELNAPAQRIEKQGDAFIVTSAGGRTFEADLVVHGAGRVPSLAGMNLEAANIAYDKRRGITVDEYLQSTTNANVYAAGDAADSGAQLTPIAGIEGDIVAENLLGTPRTRPDYRAAATAVYSTPPAAKAGLTEQEATDQGIRFELAAADLSARFDNKRLGIKHARSKILIEKDTGKIIGAHLIGNRADDLINLFSLAIEHGLTAAQLKQPPFAFPTASDDIRFTL
jgi:glutathione reductase (NADPH)